MSLMYEVAALNAAMIQAAEVCRQDMPEGEKVNAVLACFAAMKPVEAEPVVHARWVSDTYFGQRVTRCTACKMGFDEGHHAEKFPACPHCAARMDAKEVEA